MALQDFPSLFALHNDLTALDAREQAQDARFRRDRVRVVDGATLSRVDYGPSSYWLTQPQRAVVRVLLEALASATPDVDQRRLIRASGVKGVRRLGEVFAGSSAWGELVVPGSRAATYRLVELPEVEREGERRVEPE